MRIRRGMSTADTARLQSEASGYRPRLQDSPVTFPGPFSPIRASIIVMKGAAPRGDRACARRHDSAAQRSGWRSDSPCGHATPEADSARRPRDNRRHLRGFQSVQSCELRIVRDERKQPHVREAVVQRQPQLSASDAPTGVPHHVLAWSVGGGGHEPEASAASPRRSRTRACYGSRYSSGSDMARRCYL